LIGCTMLLLFFSFRSQSISPAVWVGRLLFSFAHGVSPPFFFWKMRRGRRFSALLLSVIGTLFPRPFSVVANRGPRTGVMFIFTRRSSFFLPPDAPSPNTFLSVMRASILPQSGHESLHVHCLFFFSTSFLDRDPPPLPFPPVISTFSFAFFCNFLSNSERGCSFFQILFPSSRSQQTETFFPFIAISLEHDTGPFPLC